jgi:4-aminobutyrate aminotransferase
MFQDVNVHLSDAWARYSDLIIDRAQGVYLYASNGQHYLDFSSGIGVTNIGHCHPQVVAAAKEQVERLIHGQLNLVYHRPLLDLVSELLELMPADIDRFFFSNSGAEAVEGAVKLARQATGRDNIISFRGGFHGRTVGALSLTTSNSAYRAGYQPLMAGVHVAPYPYAYHYGWTPERTADFCLGEIRHMLATESPPEDTAAMIIEPVLGEGGYVPAPKRFLRELREICDHHGILLITDEVQSGFGRTGRWFAYEHYDIAPDILVMAKGIASGFPLSGIATRQEIMDAWGPGAHGGTFGGNAVSCAAAVATIRTIRDEGLLDIADRMGKHLIERLRHIKADWPVLGDVRGLGLMVATEFTDRAGKPGTSVAKAVCAMCMEEGLFLLTCGPYRNIIRWIPPLVVKEDEIDQALDVFKHALSTVLS